MSTITKNSYVLFNYTLTDDNGKVLSSSEPHGPLDYIHGSGTLIPGLEKIMEGKKVGDAFNATIKPEDGYGKRRDDLVHVIPKEQFGFDGKIEVGMQFQAETPSGAITLTVTNVTDTNVTVDANHPFADMSLNFKVSIVEVRDATKEELTSSCGSCAGHGHGHGHGHGGSCGGCGC